MKATVYIETTIPSYLTAWPSNDLVRAADQLLTRRWWDQRDQYELRIARPVIEECNLGDPEAVLERMKALAGIQSLEEPLAVKALTAAVMIGLQLPSKATVDALHISIAAFHSCSYLLTWNCRHIANPANYRKLDAICDAAGVAKPVICTPRQILGEVS